MTAVYEKLNLKFLYPENWKLTDSGDDGVPHEIAVDSPDGAAMWSVQIYPADVQPSVDPQELLSQTLAALGQTYADLEVSAMDTTREESSACGNEALFYCLDFLVRVRLQVFEANGRHVLAWYQAEDREFEKIELVFQAITTSLLQSM